MAAPLRAWILEVHCPGPNPIFTPYQLQSWENFWTSLGLSLPTCKMEMVTRGSS